MTNEIIFSSAAVYIESCTTLKARLTAIDSIIDKLIIAAAKAADTGQIDEYWFDDGHVKIRGVYRSATQIEQSIRDYSRLRDTLIAQDANRKLGRVSRLVDYKNFFGR
jgi:hypothetical protein